MSDSSKFDIRGFLGGPIISGPARVGAHLSFGTAWGFVLEPVAAPQTRVAGIALLLILGSVLGLSFFSFDQGRLTLGRASFYGLYLAGQALLQGAMVFTFLGVYEGHLNLPAACLTGFGGMFFAKLGANLLASTSTVRRATSRD